MRIGASRIICRDFSEKIRAVFAKSRAECSNFSTAKPPLQGGLVVEKLRARTILKYSTVYCTVPGTQKYEPHSVRIAGHSRINIYQGLEGHESRYGSGTVLYNTEFRRECKTIWTPVYN